MAEESGIQFAKQRRKAWGTLMNAVPHSVLTGDGPDVLLDALQRRGFRVLGPTVRDRAIVYDDIASLADLPRGWTDEQEGGHYARPAGTAFERTARLHRRAGLRTARDRDPGPGTARRRLCRSSLPRPPRGGFHRRGQLRQARRHLLLRFDGHG